MEDYIILKRMINASQNEAGSIHNMPSQGMLSRSHSRLQSTVQKLDSHIRSTSPFHHGTSQKKYLDVQIHNTFPDSKEKSNEELVTLLRQQFEDKVKIHYFKSKEELLEKNYNQNQLYFLIVPYNEAEWAERFSKQERKNAKIFAYCLAQKKEYEKEMGKKSKSKKRIDAEYIQFFQLNDPDVPQTIVEKMDGHLDVKLKEENQNIKNWAITNRHANKKIKKRTLHFFYQEYMEQQFTAIYKSYRKKTKSSWLQIYPFKTFEDVLKKIRERQINQMKEVDIARKVTSKIMSELNIGNPSYVSMKSMKSGMDIMGSQLNTSALTQSIKSIQKLDKNDINIIICKGDHEEIEKFRKLVGAQKYDNWVLWEIQKNSSGVISRLKEVLNTQVQNIQILQDEQYKRIIHSHHLIILAHVNDDTTINMFYSHRNTLNQMELITYNDVEQFTLFLTKGVESLDNFTIAVVPGGYKTFSSQYGKVINQFNAAYRNGDSVENYKFISSSIGRMGSSVFPSSGIMSSLSDIKGGRFEQDLENIMIERDKLYHPFQGLTGVNVYLLIQENIADSILDQEITHHIQHTARLKKRTYMDASWLKKSLETLTIKDSVIVVTDDYTLRDAQSVVQHFEGVFILNVTDRTNKKTELKVYDEGTKEHIFSLIKQIPDEKSSIVRQAYDRSRGGNTKYQRFTRIMPKDLGYQPGNMFTLRFPANERDEESIKMQNNLHDDFYGDVKIEYYKKLSELRILNKSEEPIAFIIWAYDHTTKNKGSLQQKQRELEFIKDLAEHERAELRQEIIIFDKDPAQYKDLVDQKKDQYERIKFISDSWELIEIYIRGKMRRYDSIFSDETIFVFANENDRKRRDLIDYVKARADQDRNSQLNPANRIVFRNLDDPETILWKIDQESPLFKYFIVVNQNNTPYQVKDYEKIICKEQFKHEYVKVLVVNENKKKKVEPRDQFVRLNAPTYTDVGEWLCNFLVLPAPYYTITPHVIIDKSTIGYYYFLDKYSELSHKFTYQYIFTTEELKNILNSPRFRDPKSREYIYILVKNYKNMTEHMRTIEKTEDYKRGEVKFIDKEDTKNDKTKVVVKFIYEGPDNVHANVRDRVKFRHQNPRQIQKFLLNIYRRDKHIFFHNSLGQIGKVGLAIMPNQYKRVIPIDQKYEIKQWQNILRSRVEYPKTLEELVRIVNDCSYLTWYVVVPYYLRKKAFDLFGGNNNVKRIIYAHDPKVYDFRHLDEAKIVSDQNEIFVGTYPAQITQYLKFLRFNIRKPELFLEKEITNEIIQLYFQDEYRLSNKDVASLTKKNDSLIISQTGNGYKMSQLKQLLRNTNNFNYTHVFVGDRQSEEVVERFNRQNNKAVRFINVKTSDLQMTKNECRCKEWLLETNDYEEMMTMLFNLPEHRYWRATRHKGEYPVYVNSHSLNVQVYRDELQKIRRRNPNITIYTYTNLNNQIRTMKRPAHVLIHSDNLKVANETLNEKDIYYFIVSENFNPQKSYRSHGNKQFIAKKRKEFQYFMYQLPLDSSANLMPLPAPVAAAEPVPDFDSFGSRHLSLDFCSLSFFPPFSPVQREEDICPCVLMDNTLDTHPPTFNNMRFLEADVPSQPLSIAHLKKIKDSLDIPDSGNILEPGIDHCPAMDISGIRSSPDDLRVTSFPMPPFNKPQPQPIIKHKLAILHPSTYEFIQIGQMLKRNLQPDQFLVTLIPFRSEVELEEYSKNNGQKLNGFDKIVVFLSNAYRKYDPILKNMKGKLGGRMEYFIFDDSFHEHNHQKLKSHLRPYKIRRQTLPYINPSTPRHLNNCQEILILVPNQLRSKYENCAYPSHVKVVPYATKDSTYQYLHRQNTFLIIVTTAQTYHDFKVHAKISPHCILLIDTTRELPEDELYLFRIWMYSLYYGPNGDDYLARILPDLPVQPYCDKFKMLYYSNGEEELIFEPEYDQYEKIYFKDWGELYRYLVIIFKGRNNWLIKNSPGRPEVVPLHPVVYLQNKDYMRDFKNDFSEQGYLNQQKIHRKSKITMHEYADLPQIYYIDDKELSRHLQKQEAPSVVLYNTSNQGRMSFLMNKYNRHKWIPVVDNSERWIDFDGILLEVEDVRLRRKQDVFANMFNKYVFDSWNDMRYFYLSNKANLDKARNIFFRTREELVQIYNTEPNLLMTVFVEAKDINFMPQILMAQANEPSGRVKLILISVDFVDEESLLYIKFNQIDPVIKHINDVENAGRIDFMVYHEGEGERTVQTLIQKRRLRGLDDRVYTCMDQVEDIAIEIKGKYKKVYVVCFDHQKEQIQEIFSKHSIRNKGIPHEGVQFFYIDRKSFIIPNASRMQPSNLNYLPQNKVEAEEVHVNVQVTRKTEGRPQENQRIITHQEVITISNQNDEDQNDYGLPSMDSNIKPNKLESILAGKNYVLNIDDQLKGLFPVGKFFANKATFFNHHNRIPTADNDSAQLIISTEITPQMVAYSQDPSKFVIVVGEVQPNQKNIGNVLLMKEEEIPGLIKKLQGSSVEDEFNNIRNLEDYDKVRVVYDRDVDFDSKRRLLAASQKNEKIIPILYQNPNQLKSYLKEPDSLLLLMMSDVPAGIVDAVQRENKTIVRKRRGRVKMIVNKKSDSDIDGLETILEEEEGQQDGDNLKYLSDEQVDVYLKLFQNSPEDKRPKIIKPDEWQVQPENRFKTAEEVDDDNITRLNVHSKIDEQDLLHQNQIQKIKQRLTGDLIVLVVDNAKRGQVDEAIKRFNILVQGYTNSMNLENDIRDRKDNVTIAVVDRNILDKVPAIKKKFPQTAFILESDNLHDQGIDVYRPYISGQIRKIADLDKIIADLYQENERIRFNQESNRAASRFEMKRTSVVDPSIQSIFSVGMNNQKSKKVFLFYKEPDNIQIRSKLGQNFTHLNYIPYKSIADFKRVIDNYNNYTNIVIANGSDIPDIEEVVSKKKGLIYVIRFKPPGELRDNHKVKKLLSTYNPDDLEKYIRDQIAKYSLALPYEDINLKSKANKNVEVKKYTQKYEPNTFGTTPRFPRDFIPDKSKQSTYSRRYMKSTSSKSKLMSRLQTLSPPAQRGNEYYQN